ncbi:dendritic cell-specific transmembrane protein [Polymixia lowei]
MPFSCMPLKRSIRDVGYAAVDVYTTGNRVGLWKIIILLLTCGLLSFILSSLLFLYLFYTLGYETAVSGGIAGCFGILLTTALFLSNQVRCIGILFMISCFMKMSRKLLLTIGITYVLLKNIQNTLENLTGLIRSMICNLQAKKAAIVLTPLDNYVKMLKWVGDALGKVNDLGVVKFDSKLQISTRVESDKFREKLFDAEKNLNETARYVHSVMSTVVSVAHRMFPVISFLFLMIFIGLHIRKYCSDMKYENMFISSKFVCFDAKQRVEGRPHVLPLTPDEEKIYISIPSLRPTTQEGKSMVKFGIPVLSHFVAWVIFISVDALMYYFVDIVTTQLSELEPFNIPLILNVKVTKTILGIPSNDEDHSKDFSYSVTLFEKNCLPKPKLLLSNSIVPLAVILVALLIMAMMAAKLTQLRLMVCERFFSIYADDRVKHLHAKILRRRSKKKGADANDSDLRPLDLFKPHFWCPLLFRRKEDGSPKDSSVSVA